MSDLPKLLITGASGFTGRHACIHFSKAGFNVFGVTRKSYFDTEAKMELCDLTDKDAVTRLVKKIKPDYLLHLAGQNHVGQSWIDPLQTFEANSLSTLYLIEALRMENPNCKIVVVGSALQFDPQHLSTLAHPYSLSKTIQVLLAQSWEVLYGMNIVIAKPSNLIGPGFSNGICSIIAKKIVEMEDNQLEKIIEVTNLYIQRDFLDVRDAVGGYETLLSKGISGEIYDIASGKSRSLEDIINCFKTIAAVDFEVNSQINNLIESPVTIMPVKLMYLGWKPTFSIESSIEDILTFFRENKSK